MSTERVTVLTFENLDRGRGVWNGTQRESDESSGGVTHASLGARANVAFVGAGDRTRKE